MTRHAALAIIRLHLKRCPGCGYDVSNAHTAVCPECGRDMTGDAEVRGRVRVPKIRIVRNWIVVAALLPSLLALTSWLLPFRWVPRSWPLWMVPTFFFGLTTLVVAALWMRAFLSRPPERFWPWWSMVLFVGAAGPWPFCSRGCGACFCGSEMRAWLWGDWDS